MTSIANHYDDLMKSIVTYMHDGNFDQAKLKLLYILSYQPKNFDALSLLGFIYGVQNNHLDAKNTLIKALKVKPKDEIVLINLAKSLYELNEVNEAIKLLINSEKIYPNRSIFFHLHAKCLIRLGRNNDSIEYFNKAIKLDPTPELFTDFGNTLSELLCYEDALVCYDAAVDLQPSHYEALLGKGNVLHKLKRDKDAIIYFDRTISLEPNCLEAWANKGAILQEHFPDEAAKCYLKSFELSKNNGNFFLGRAHHQLMLCCDWTDYLKFTTLIDRNIIDGYKSAEPFGYQGIARSEALLYKCAQLFCEEKYPAKFSLDTSFKHVHDKIRVGYLCGEFKEHATSILLTGVWELHDKSRFEIYAFDNGGADKSALRIRIEKAFNKIIDISNKSDLEVLQLMQALEVDILVNLNGYFGKARQGVFSHKSVPIQVNYLGFPGTTGSNYIDYLIADKIILPESSRQYYSEKIAYLPNSYQANDYKREMSNHKLSKPEQGLPEDAFIFCCFNNSYKITPEIFDGWMRILKATNNSVLWLLDYAPTVSDNLKTEAAIRGVDKSRIIFGKKMPLEHHLARHNLADLFLDTLPYNAHTTASDALWTGLPVLTCLGSTFPGRVASSLLTAIQLPELITTTQEEYETLAIELAMNPKKLEIIKLKLAKNRLTAPLFDTPLFTKNLEAAYIKMYERYQAELLPEHIYI
jgi:predicted O-linked N-acetylglucosamine transferase (SPINDLY family)